MSTPIEITESNFQAEVVQSESPVLIDLWAAWCGPCRLVAPIVDEIAYDYQGRIKVGKVDVDAEPGLAARFNALSIPTIVLVKDGEVVASAVGARPKAALVEALELDLHAPQSYNHWPATPKRGAEILRSGHPSTVGPDDDKAQQAGNQPPVTGLPIRLSARPRRQHRIEAASTASVGNLHRRELRCHRVDRLQAVAGDVGDHRLARRRSRRARPASAARPR